MQGERVVLEETRSVRGFLVGQIVWILLALTVAALMVWTLGSAATGVAVFGILVLGGVQLLALGVIGEYLGRLHLNVNRKPQYVIRTVRS